MEVPPVFCSTIATGIISPHSFIEVISRSDQIHKCFQKHLKLLENWILVWNEVGQACTMSRAVAGVGERGRVVFK